MNDQDYTDFLATLGEEYCEVVTPLCEHGAQPQDGYEVFGKVFGYNDITPEKLHAAQTSTGDLARICDAARQWHESDRISDAQVREVLRRVLRRWPAGADDRQAGSDAFRWLDSNMVASAEAPDEALDWVFMLRAEDWPLLESIWLERPAAWREACAYLLGHGPVAPSQRLLRLALADPDGNVATEAAVSLCAQTIEHPDEAPFDPSLLPRLKELRGRDSRDIMAEVDEILRRHGGAP